MDIEDACFEVEVNATYLLEKIEKIQKGEDMLPSDLEKFVRENIEVFIIASPGRRTTVLDLKEVEI